MPIIDGEEKKSGYSSEAMERRAKEKDIAKRTKQGIEETFNPPPDPITKAFRRLTGMKDE